MTTRSAWTRVAAVMAGVALGGFFVTTGHDGRTLHAQVSPGVMASGESSTRNPKHERQSPANPRSLDEAVAWLGSDQWSVRDAAQHWLLRQPAVVRSDIEQRIDETSDPEVTARLEDVALHLYLKSLTPLHGKASMLGISLGLEPVRLGARGEDVRMGVAVLGLQPGFPAAEVLQVGDRVVGMEGQAFDLEMSIENFRARINSLSPGETVELIVVRGKEELKMPVMLAGVPEGGSAAMSNYMAIRQRQAEDYTLQILARIQKRELQLGRHGLTVKASAAAARDGNGDLMNGNEGWALPPR